MLRLDDDQVVEKRFIFDWHNYIDCESSSLRLPRSRSALAHTNRRAQCNRETLASVIRILAKWIVRNAFSCELESLAQGQTTTARLIQALLGSFVAQCSLWKGPRPQRKYFATISAVVAELVQLVNVRLKPLTRRATRDASAPLL